MAIRKTSDWAWVGISVGFLAIGGYVAKTSAFVQDLATTVIFQGKEAHEQKEDLKYIRGRVDDIYNRLPPRTK